VSENPQWEQFLLTALDKYLVKNDFPADANPKALRTLLWRTVCNMSKYADGQTLVKKLNREVLTTAAKTLQDHKTDANLVNAAILALSNSVFIKVACSHLQDFVPSAQEQVHKALSENLSSENENTVLAILNLFCKFLESWPEYRQLAQGAARAELKTKLDFLKYHKSDGVKLLVEDVFLLLG